MGRVCALLLAGLAAGCLFHRGSETVFVERVKGIDARWAVVRKGPDTVLDVKGDTALLKVAGKTLELRGVGTLRGRLVADGADLVLDDGTVVTVQAGILRVQKGNSIRKVPLARLAKNRRTVIADGRIRVE